MKIHNLNQLPTVDYREVKPLQGELKDLSDERGEKLKRVLEKRGFTSPLLIWRNPKDGLLYLMDGHQRQRVMTKYDLSDDGDYEVPFALIPGKNEREAREQLLEIDSRYGRTTVEGLDAFAFDLELKDMDIALSDINLNLMNVSEPVTPEGPEPPTTSGKRYSTEQLRVLVKSYYPEKERDIVEFLAWLEEREYTG